MKKLISATLAASLALSLAACGSSASTDSVAASSESTAASSAAAESTAETGELAGTTLKVAASPTPHAEILEVAKQILAAKGVTLDIQSTTTMWYPIPWWMTHRHRQLLPAPALSGGLQRSEQHPHRVRGRIHVEPMGLYGGKQTTLDAISGK